MSNGFILYKFKMGIELDIGDWDFICHWDLGIGILNEI
jgi:hypothetical protein